MDMLAAASAAVSGCDGNAADILSQLRGSYPSSEDKNDTPSSPSSESTNTTQLLNRPWHRSEDELLRHLVAKMLPLSSPRRSSLSSGSEKTVWEDIADEFEDRSAQQCFDRWHKVLNSESIKGPWSPAEDDQLIELVKQYGGKHWARIASMLPGRTGKQCRERWCNNLDPTLKKGAWTPEEDVIILEMQAKLGTRWAEIAKSLPGRSDNAVKNRWYSTCSRMLRQHSVPSVDLGSPRSVPNASTHAAPSSSSAEAQDEVSFEADEQLPAEPAAASSPSTPALQSGARRPVVISSVLPASPSPRTKRKLTADTEAREGPTKAFAVSAVRPMRATQTVAPDLMSKHADWAESVQTHRSSGLNLPGGWNRLAVRLPQAQDVCRPLPSALSVESI